jgi:hypothetical protein
VLGLLRTDSAEALREVMAVLVLVVYSVRGSSSNAASSPISRSLFGQGEEPPDAEVQAERAEREEPSG